MDNNRTILAVVLIVLLWSAYSLFFAPQQQQIDNNVVETQQNSDSVVVEKNTVQKDNDQKIDIKEDNNLIDQQNLKERIIEVTNDFYKVKLNSKGASLSYIELLKYKKDKEENSENYILYDSENKIGNLLISGSDGFYLPKNINYQLLTDEDNYDVTNQNLELKFVADVNGVKIFKKYIFFKQSYHFDIAVEIINNSSNNISGNLNIILDTPWDEDKKSQLYTFVGPVSYNGQDLLEDKPDDLNESPKTYKENIVWSGYTSKYFLMALKPKDTVDQLYIDNNDTTIENIFTSDNFNLNDNNSVIFNYSAYFGPKQLEFLQESNNQFEEIIHYGFFHPLAKPLIVVLKFFYNFTGNYGFSIILLTVCIKIIFWPLTQKSYKSMKGMQKLQPEMKRLKEKYGSDKQKLNQEMMAFYKEHKVNPLGGCLPMLIQIPVFFALYRVLLASIELRHAPFILWITDLSAKDPYYVTPLIMGVTMFLQQKMTPTNMDPTQEKIMLMMPVVFTFMFLNFPSGLVIYWLVNNLLTILQQYLIRRQPD